MGQKTKRKMNISLIGGEPTLHPGMLNFCKSILNNIQDACVEVLTNFS